MGGEVDALTCQALASNQQSFVKLSCLMEVGVIKDMLCPSVQLRHDFSPLDDVLCS